jgi:hypothetical protein
MSKRQGAADQRAKLIKIETKVASNRDTSRDVGKLRNAVVLATTPRSGLNGMFRDGISLRRRLDESENKPVKLRNQGVSVT